MGQPVTSLPMVIHVDKDKCINCHACIAVCPVKICNDGSGAYVNLQSDSCIGCGRCLAACTHGARYFTDDFGPFMASAARSEKMIAVVAPSVVSNFPDEYLRLNGWLKKLGVSAVFDVSFGAELCAKTYAAYIRRHSPQVVISQPCPAIVTYIQVHHPELLQYLAPVDSPMLHTMKMARRFFPQYAGHKIVVISPCPAKKREQIETGYGDYNVTYSSIREYLRSSGTSLLDFREMAYATPTPETAVLFPQPRGLVQTLERWLPGVEDQTRTIEGQDAVYSYLAALPETICHHPATVPLLIDCLNCRNGCNFGPAAIASAREIDAVEYRTKKRNRDLHDEKGKQIGRRNLDVERLLFDYWAEDMYAREYADLSDNNKVRRPNAEEQKAILASMHKYSEKDQYNCCACGYGTCLDMTTAIFNGLNRPENCHHYLAIERETAQRELTEYRDHLEVQVEERTAELHAANEELQQGIDSCMRVEQELQDSEQKLREVVQGSPIAKFVLDKDHKVLCWNKAMEQLSGLAAVEITGTSDHWKAFYESPQDCLADLLLDGREAVIASQYQEKCKKSELLDGAYEGSDLFTTGGEKKWLYFTAVAIKDARGNVVGAVETVMDVTKQRITEMQLAKSQQAAEAANRAKSEFLANISHELRTPLHGILSYARFGLDEAETADPGELREFFGNVDHCAHTLLDLVNDLLDLSKMEAGRMSYEYQRVDVRGLIDMVVDEFRLLCAEQRVTIRYERLAKPVVANLDSSRIQQVLRNLLSNAVKFSPAEATIGVQLRPSDDAIVIGVADEGPGIPSDELEAVFDKFVQSSKTKASQGGTGLGLAICRQIVAGHEGRIWVENNAGGGCTFFVELPNATNEALPEPREPAMACKTENY